MHSASWYMMCDIGGSLWGTAMFAAALLAPGYLFCRWQNLCGFRAKSPAEQLTWSVAVSLGVAPVAAVALTWLFGLTAAAVCFAVASALAMVLFVRTRPLLTLRRGHAWFLLWTVFVALSLVDIGWGDKLWMSVTTFDHAVRVPLVDAVMRTGVVPANPLYWPGHAAPLRYYYFWYVVCGVVAKLAHISPRQALIASCVWPLAGVVAMIALYGKYLLDWTGPALRSRTRLAVVMLAVTGLDGLIALFVWLSGQASGGDMEWWSVDQVTSWADTFLWVPHHAAALVACLLCLLLFWQARSQPDSRWRLGIVAGISFAGAFGCSTFVAAGFAIVMACYVVRLLCIDRNRAQLASIAVAAVVAGLLLAPYLAQLSRASAGSGPQQHVLKLQVRQMLDPSMLYGVPGIRALHNHKFLQADVAALFLLVPGYCIELGFFAVVAWFVSRQKNRTEGERTLVFLFAASLVGVSFIRSAVLTTNDYGVRASLLMQFFVLLLAVRVWEESRGWLRRSLFALACVGVCGSLYQVLNLRLYLPWQQAHANPDMRELAERNFALRDAYQQLDRVVRREARVQYGAPAGGFFDSVHTLETRRQLIAAGTTGHECNTGFGGEVSACAPIRAIGGALFDASAPAISAQRAAQLCTAMGAQYLVATRWDAIWNGRYAWPWTLPAVVATPQVRVVSCQTSR